jgi:hypothetical protein
MGSRCERWWRMKPPEFNDSNHAELFPAEIRKILPAWFQRAMFPTSEL